jgi:hypothetical protein
VSNTAPGAVKSQQVSPPVAIAAIVGIAVFGWLLLGDDGGELPETAATPPPLFGEAPPCGAEGPGALHAAREAAEAAAAKSERYVFSAQDGVTAVTLYARAEACFGRSGAPADARRMATEREAMTRRIDEDYKTHRLRLERSLHNARFPEALVEAHAIRALTGHLEGPYVDWLTLLERRLQMLVDKANLKAAGGQ